MGTWLYHLLGLLKARATSSEIFRFLSAAVHEFLVNLALAFHSFLLETFSSFPAIFGSHLNLSGFQLLTVWC